MTAKLKSSPELKALLNRVDATLRETTGLLTELRQSRTHRMRMAETGREVRAGLIGRR